MKVNLNLNTPAKSQQQFSNESSENVIKNINNMQNLQKKYINFGSKTNNLGDSLGAIFHESISFSSNTKNSAEINAIKERSFPDLVKKLLELDN